MSDTVAGNLVCDETRAAARIENDGKAAGEGPEQLENGDIKGDAGDGKPDAGFGTYGEVHAGEHEPVIDQALWDQAQAQLASNVAIRRSGKSSKDPSLLAGLLYDGEGNRMTPSHTAKDGKRYRYYISNHLIAGTTRSRKTKSGEGLRIAAQEIDGHVIAAIAMFLADPQKIVAELCPDDAAPAVATTALRQARSLGETLTAEGTPSFSRLQHRIHLYASASG